MRILENIVRKNLIEKINHPMRLTENVRVSNNLQYHLDHNLSLDETVFKTYSESFLNLINEVRDLFHLGMVDLNENDISIIESDLGKSIIQIEKDTKRMGLSIQFHWKQ